MGATASSAALGAMAMMADELTRPPAQPPAPPEPCRPGLNGSWPSARMLRHLTLHKRATARELAQVAGVRSSAVGGLLQHHVQMGRVVVDRTLLPVVYVLQEDTRKHVPLKRRGRYDWPTVSRAELLEWHDAALTKPDSDITVLCWGSEGFFCGWWDDGMGCWIGCESGGTVLGVTHWAQPEGPPGLERDDQSQTTGDAA